MEQAAWNMLFSWITGSRCFIPEGCSPPLSGIVVYATLLAAIAGGYWFYTRR
ncbi:MAG: hypothetical protein ABEJ75_04440 [Candidatus Nanohaloarchaea archaeon]